MIEHSYDEYDPVYTEMKNALLKEKDKAEKLQKKKNKWFGIVGLAFFIGSVLLVIYTIFPHYPSIGRMFSFMLMNIKIHIMGFGIFFVCQIMFSKYVREYNKAEESLESLRKETISRTEELWLNSGYWDKREKEFEKILKEHDINLYYKN